MLSVARWARTQLRRLSAAYPRRVVRREFEQQTFRRFNERPVELMFVFQKLAALYPKTILDVGTGTTALPQVLRSGGALVTAIDNIRDYWPGGMHNRHYHVIDDDICHTRLTGLFDFITCISVLEHVREPGLAVRSLCALLRPGGHLVLSFPYSEPTHVDNVYALPGSSYGQSASYVTRSYCRTDLDRWLTPLDVDIVDQQYWRYWTGEFWTVGEQIIPPIQASATEPHQLSCLLIRRQ